MWKTRIQGSIVSGLCKPLPSMHKPSHQAKDHAVKDSTGCSKEAHASTKSRQRDFTKRQHHYSNTVISRTCQTKGRTIMHVSTLQDIQDVLVLASRSGAEKDEPEGVRYIQLSDTITSQMIAAIQTTLNNTKENSHGQK